MPPIFRPLLALAVTLAASACDKGRLFVDVTDAPVDDATAVEIQFEGLEVVRTDGSAERFSFSPRQVDLLQLQNGNVTALLDNVDIDEGDYAGIRLLISAPASGDADSSVTIGTAERRLELPDAHAELLEVDLAFSVEAGDDRHLTIDFDLRNSILPQDGSSDFTLKPALRLVQNDQVGEIAGEVDDARIVAGCVPAVYVFAGESRTPDDAGSTTPPLTSAKVVLANAVYTYRVAFLPPGGYTVAFTCDAGIDNARDDQDLAFAGAGNARVAIDRTTTVDF